MYLMCSQGSTKKRKLTLSNTQIISFDSKYHGAWQAIPIAVSDKLKAEKIDVVIKFGMNLLRINNGISSIPILSFHHGNPAKYDTPHILDHSLR